MPRLRFICALITKENDYQMEQAASARTAAQNLGVDVEIAFGDGNAITQSTQILKHVQALPDQRPSGIVVEPVGGTALPQVAKAAVTAGIGWAVLNRDADYTTELRRIAKVPVFSLATDHQAVGEIQAKQLAALLPSGGQVLYIQGPSENFATKERILGLQRVLNPAIKLTTLRAQWTEESARRSIESWLTLTSGKKVTMDAVAAQNDAMAVGARKALLSVIHPAEREMWQSLPYLGVDGVPTTGQAWVRAGTLKATVVTPATAGEAIVMMAQSLTKSTMVPERSFISPTSFPTTEKLSADVQQPA
ncbi:MAG: sugar ABC transporter substrate-binding protein [Candidatus Acidiferrales bacterium]